MVDEILECKSPEPMIPLNIEENVNIAEEDDSECSVDPETVILKMTRRTVTYYDGITEIVQETAGIVFHSKTIPAEELDVLKFATDVLSEIPEHFQNRNVKIVKFKKMLIEIRASV